MPKVVVLPNVPSQLARFFGEVASEHIPELLERLEEYMRKTTAVIERCADGERKDALIAQRSAILGLLDQARTKAGGLI
ncbi:hypothetical protein [Bradyrhizobium sp. CCBAU 53338]|uniref:hypothetical protein n=1 Tax=Bradyrhizobium sp. CCBAU 53338 TaxID=1325111 RepID=UPI00188A6510|nr:hypothetical protein [Bradyrhizobium sp. CCBAU 53338]QOZ54447.1 hypothetical protein XH90_26015 [Bradyrhizobium sp. CCBAU 53338]